AEATDAVTQQAVTDPVKAAVDFTRDLTDRANAAFVDTTDEALQLANFQAVLNEGLALDYLGRFMLGSAARDLTEAQSARYDAVFPRYITRLYAEQFKDIAGKQLTINDATPFGRRDVIVRTQFLRDDGSPVNVDWRARKLRTEGHKMLDIIVSGVSIMTVKREEFSGFIAANGVDALIERLEQDASV
ncbi:MAG: ABC transporter substrate-binding protein, partial [Pseudomonadota bacterium]